jgi:cell division protein FtsW (lipid II flippase)
LAGVGRRLELHGLAWAVGLGAAAVVHWARYPDSPPVGLVWVGVVPASLLAADLLLRPEDRVLLPLTSLLVAVGLVTAYRLQPEQLAWQAAWSCAGVALLAACFRAAGFPPLRWAAVWAVLLALSAALPWVVLWASGRPAAGAAQGLLAELSSEGAKFFFLLAGASELQHGGVRGPLVVVWAASVALQVVRGDVATGAVLTWVGLVLAYCATGGRRAVVPVAAGFLVLAGLAHVRVPHLVERVRGWLDPWADPLGFGYPLVQSLFAMGSGGIAGVGPGFGYPELVPQAQLAFALAAVGEEWGFAGVLGLLAAYALWVGRALRAAGLSPTRWGRLIGAGVAALVASQAFLAAAGATGLLPATGAQLPFVGQGGLSVAVHLAALGLVLALPQARGAGR